PGRCTCPHTEKSFVPVLLGFDRHSALYQAAPRLMMGGTAASVSTLLIVVGSPNNPAAAGNGGLIRGLPRLPSIEFIRAVSSPQMYAPAPRCRWILMSPNTPAAFASRSEEHTSELQSPDHLVCRPLLDKHKNFLETRL